MRRRIKETAWEKQNQREGFSETFKPLISQFEKPEDPKTKNIFTQNQEMLRNQLALTEGLRDNQKAITDGFKQFERLADMRELPQIEHDDNQKQIKDLIDFDDYQEQPKKTIKYNLERDFSKEDLEYLDLLGYPRPNDFVKNERATLDKMIDEVRGQRKSLGHEIGGMKRKKDQTKQIKEFIKDNQGAHDMLGKYMDILTIYLDTVKLQEGKGIIKVGGL